MKTIIAIFFIAFDLAASLAAAPHITTVESRPYLAPVTVEGWRYSVPRLTQCTSIQH